MTSGNGQAIDGCVFHDWASIEQLTPYMSAGWQEALLRPGNPDGPNQARGMPLYRSPRDPFDPASYPEGGRPGSDLGLLAEQVFDGSRERVVLGYGEGGLLASAFTNPAAAQVLSSALNEWTRQQWLARDDRLFGLILVSTAIPQGAAAEVRRSGSSDRFVGVALGTNGLDRPFGQAVYHPIYEAASEMQLPLVIQTGSDTSPSLNTSPIGGGMAATYAETEIWSVHPLATHLASLVFDGVFDLFPNLEVLLVGGGLSWFPSFVWRMDAAWNHMRSEAPLLKDLPSAYLRRHVRLATTGMEHPADPQVLPTALGTVPWIDETLLYGSGYPKRDWEQPAEVASSLPSEWSDQLLHENAAGFFRFPNSSTQGESQ
jgi:predicted TIM-barrel fold metal-dependent hydrolase